MKNHKHTILVDLQHGDTGKGKFIDWYSNQHNIKHVVRYNGGPNAGHTVYIEGKKYVTHIIPSGILTPGVNCYIGPGCLVNPEKLEAEIAELKSLGVENIEKRLFIDLRCNIITEEHIARDIAAEATNPVGSTKQGMAPCYADKYARKGRNFQNTLLPGLSFMTCDVGSILRNLPDGTEILYEGAQGTMLDIDVGDYPNVTSTHCVAHYAPIGSGYGRMRDVKVIGVAKPYLTKVGTGHFPSSIEGSWQAEFLRDIGKEYGATTGRPRKIGWLNMPELELATDINGVDELVLLKNDVLLELPEFSVYDPGYEEDPVFHKNEFENFLKYVEGHTGVRVKYLGMGPNRDQLIVRE